ncbi:MAG: hypothetical protein JWQ20_1148 [Conexibacter sp.]|nr:hypothetical protein [Conexibacter sp.]
MRAVAERVAAKIAAQAWVLDDTGFPEDGKRSPGVQRQYSGTLGKIGSCQIGVSVHADGTKGTVPLSWALYLPQEWCQDGERRRRAKVPPGVEFKTKPELGVELVERAAGWDLPAGTIDRGGPGHEAPTRARTWLPSIAARHQSIAPAALSFSSGCWCRASQSPAACQSRRRRHAVTPEP